MLKTGKQCIQKETNYNDKTGGVLSVFGTNAVNPLENKYHSLNFTETLSLLPILNYIFYYIEADQL